MALHAKAKAAPGYRFYALYDKISRDDILAHAYAQCRSNQGARAVNGQDFEAVEGYGVERWLGELALALRAETYRPEPIRRVFIPKANGKFRPLAISTVHSPRDQTVESPWRLSFPERHRGMPQVPLDSGQSPAVPVGAASRRLLRKSLGRALNAARCCAHCAVPTDAA